MNVGRTVFSQLTDHIDEYIFKTIVAKHKGNDFSKNSFGAGYTMGGKYVDSITGGIAMVYRQAIVFSVGYFASDQMPNYIVGGGK